MKKVDDLEKIFEEKYKKLNPEQKQAVDSIDGPTMVIAGPGTGKTTILTLRIANILLKTDTPAGAILALTFTDAGVSAMRTKLREIIGSRADEVRIHTFHSFAGSVIAEFPEHFIHLSSTTQLTDVEAEGFVRQILREKNFAKLRPLGDTDYYIGKIIGAIGDCKKEDWSFETVSDFAKQEIERIKNDLDSVSSRGSTKGELKAEAKKRIERCDRTLLFTSVYEKYEELKKSKNKMDFDDLLFGLLSAMKTDELLLQLLQEKFLYILVDEHQDTNDSQNLVVSRLASFFDNPNLFVVGDEKQAIYRFQGASVENFLRFEKLWKSMKVISLSKNYRSHQSILDASFKMIEENYNEDEHQKLRIKLHSNSSHKQKPIEVVTSGNTVASDEVLVMRLLEIQKNEPDSTTAVIVRSNREIERILALCEANSVSAKAERGVNIFSDPFGVAYFKCLEFLVDPTKLSALSDTLSLGLWNKNFAESVSLIQKIYSGQVTGISKEIPELKVLQDEALKLGPIQYLITIFEMSGLNSHLLKNPLSVEVWRGIISLATELALGLNIYNPQDLIRELLAYKISAENKSIKIRSGIASAPIQIMTAHSSKGLEYDYVFLPFSTEQSWMHRARTSPFVLPLEKDEGDEIRDARRLFYVCLTRARKHIVILTSETDMLGKALTRLRFIEELHKDHVLFVNTPASQKIPKVLMGEALNSQRNLEIVEYAKNILVSKGLSVTALNHFLTCPSEFYYKSILKLPEAPSPSSEKGIAMHKALSLVWKQEKRDVKQIKNIIKETVTSYFQKSLLAVFEKEIIVDELISHSDAVAECMVRTFGLAEKVLTESWFETDYNTEFKKEKVVVRLHGQMDAVVDLGSSVKVFDYKTREAMSENAVRGLTESSDGGYFRQLVFYKMLLSEQYNFKGKEIEPTLIFIKPDSKGRCATVELSILKSDIEKVRQDIDTVVQSVWSGGFLTDSCDDTDCKWCKMKKEFLN